MIEASICDPDEVLRGWHSANRIRYVPRHLSFANESEPLPACLSHLRVSAI
jgi:hypothetical protein